MEMIAGSCRFGLWFVHAYWSGTVVHRIRFATTGIDGPVPPLIQKYCAGKVVDCSRLTSIAPETMGELYATIYRIVRAIPYGMTATYGEVARRAGTSPRVVGQAMARNPTPLVIPCHRVVGAQGIGGFSPSVEIKEALLAMENRGVNTRAIKTRNNEQVADSHAQVNRGANAEGNSIKVRSPRKHKHGSAGQDTSPKGGR